MTRENHQRYMEGFGAAMLQDDYFGAAKPVMAAPLKATSVVRARPASVVRRAAARSFIRVKSNVMQAVRAGTMSADQARAVLNKAGKIVSATGTPVYVRSAKVQKTLSAAGPQAPGADPATALVKAPTLYTSRLSEEEEALLREDSPEIQEKFRLAIAKLKRGVSKRSRTMMGFDEFGYDPDEDDDYDDFGGNLLAEEAELWSESYVDQFGAKRRLDTVKIRYDLDTNMDAWVKDYRPTERSMRDGHERSYARRAAKYHWNYLVYTLGEAYGVGRTTIARIGSGMLSIFQQEASDKAAEWSKGLFGYDNSGQWEYDKQHGGTRWGPRSMGGGYGTF